MAALPPEPPLRKRTWLRWTAVGVAASLALVATGVLLGHCLRFMMQTDNSINANTWIGFAGSVIGAVIGGLAAVLVLLLSNWIERKKQRAEAQRKADEQRLDLVDELGDLVGTLDLGAGIDLQGVSRAGLKASRIVGKIDRMSPDPCGDRHVSIALSNAAQAFRETSAAGLNDQSIRWLAEQLLPAIETLTASITSRDAAIIATDANHLLQVVHSRPEDPDLTT